MKPIGLDELGTVCHGSLRHCDLVDAFIGDLECQLSKQPVDDDDANTLREMLTHCQAECVRSGRPVDDEDVLAEWVVALSDALDQFAPEGYYFGAHCDDGSDFGYWPCEGGRLQ